MRQIFFDTETTGLSVKEGHRVIEIACLEVIERTITGRYFHTYVNPDRDIDADATAIHNITRQDLQDKPRFGEVAQQFLDFIEDAELIAHNAPFDIEFLDAELRQVSLPVLSQTHRVTDTLVMARRRFPAGRCSLDDLCNRFEIDRSKRRFHGALIDTELLAQVYLAMTRGQESLAIAEQTVLGLMSTQRNPADRPSICRCEVDTKDQEAHLQYLAGLKKAAQNGEIFWPETL